MCSLNKNNIRKSLFKKLEVYIFILYITFVFKLWSNLKFKQVLCKQGEHRHSTLRQYLA